MHAPDLKVQLSTSERLPFADLYRDRPLCLVFLRHLGCIFCREYVARMRKLKDANIVFVTADTPENAEALRAEMGSPHRFICDPERHLHGAFDIGLGGRAQVLHPGVFTRGIKAMMAGHRQVPGGGDRMQMPGVFVIGQDGEVKWEHKARHIADTPSPEEISRHLD